MSVNAIDCTGLNPTQISNLSKQGVKYVGRYLSRSTWKGLTLGEVANIKSAGMDIFSIYETNPTYAGYFSAATGETDALDAVALAKSVGQPENTAIYFTVDYDAQSANFPAILDYFQAIRANLGNYKLGAYGSFTTLNYLYQNNAADYWFQTVAWSGGQHCNFLNIFQYQIDKTNWNDTGANVDLDNVEKSDIGAWGQVNKPPEVANTTKYPVQPVSTGNPIVAKVEVIVDSLNCRQHPDVNSPVLFVAKKGQLYNVTANINDWHEVIIDNQGHNGYLFGNNGTYLSLVKDQPQSPQPVYHIVQSGDTVSELAIVNGTTIAQISTWNGLKDANKISIGQKLRVK